MRVYIAGSYKSKDRLRVIRDRLNRDKRVRVVAQWLDEKEVHDPTIEQKQAYAVRDIGDIASCDVFIFDTLEPSTTGSRECELGMVIGIVALRPMFIIRVGPPTSIYHYAADQAYKTWEEALMVSPWDALHA